MDQVALVALVVLEVHHCLVVLEDRRVRVKDLVVAEATLEVVVASSVPSVQSSLSSKPVLESSLVANAPDAPP